MTQYEPLLKIASGGTAAVHVAVATGAQGFRQVVAVKKPHAHLVDDPSFVKALVEEAKIASRLHHANVVDVRDVVEQGGSVDLVMDYVDGASLSDLIRAWIEEKTESTRPAAIRIVLDACEGLRAVHDLTGEDGRPLGLVHRDVSPANILVGVDGVARLADFGLAKPLAAVERTTSEGALRGKLGYMAPEYIRGRKDIDRRVDVFAMGVVLWETLAKKRLFRGENDADTLDKVQRLDPAPLGDAALDEVVRRACAKDPAERFASIEALATELEKVARAEGMLATHADVRAAFPAALRAKLDARRKEIQEALARTDKPIPEPPSRQSARLFKIGVPVAVVVGALVGFAQLRHEENLPAIQGEPHTFEAQHVIRADEPRRREEAAPATSTSAPSPQGTQNKGPHDKWPRPNPYAR